MGSQPASTGEAELIFLGTGTSSSIPQISCITAPADKKPCITCLSTLTPTGKKNIRRNTSCAIRINGIDGKKTIVIDVGKNFQASAIEWFPKFGLRRIDAVLLTHAHADAMNGLDDLRGWTLKNSIQTHIDIYVSHATFIEVQRSFPYLVAKEYASGGGDVPEVKWHIIEDKVPFEMEGTGIQVTPFAVHHGRLFSTNTPPACIPTPNSTVPPTPTMPGVSLPIRVTLEGQNETIHPYICFGFKIQDALVYLSDVSYIPEGTWSMLEAQRENGTLPVLVLDCLGLRPHTSHFGLADSIATARRMGAARTYLTGFGHEVPHDDYVAIGEFAGGKYDSDTAELTTTQQRGISLIGEGRSIWLRPAHDGLRVFVNQEGIVKDESYDEILGNDAL